MLTENLDQRTAVVRGFNRFYTRQIGVLQEGLLDTSFSLTEARVLYELAHRDQSTAAALGSDLGLDAGYLSRILSSFERRNLIEKTPSEGDRRQSRLALTKRGRKPFGPLEARSIGQAAAMLGTLPEAGQRRLISAMQTVQDLLDPRPESPGAGRASYLLRPRRPGGV